MTIGLLSSASLPTDLARKSFAAAINLLMPNGGAPLYAITGLLKEKTALQVQHGYWSKRMIFPRAILAAAATNVAITLTLDVTTDASNQYTFNNLVKGDLLRNITTGEIVMVQSFASPTLTVTRAIGTIAAAAMSNADQLYHIGNAFEEGSVRPTAVAIQPTFVSNYTHIFRNSWAVTKTSAAMPWVVGDSQVASSRRDCAALHAMAIEKALFWSQKFMGTGSNGQPLHTMDGMLSIISQYAASNIVTVNTGAGSTTTWTTLEAALEKTLDVQTDPSSGPIRTVFMGGVAKRTITNVVRLNSEYEIAAGSEPNSWGLQIMTLRTPRGTFELIDHPLFNAYGSSAALAATAFIIDLSAIAIAYLRRTEDLAYNQNGTPVDSGIDAVGGTLTTELTLECINPAACGILYGVQSPAVG